MVAKLHSSLNKPVAQAQAASLFKYILSFVTMTLQRVKYKETRIQLLDQNCISQLNLSLVLSQAHPVVALVVLQLNKRDDEHFNNCD